MINDQKARSDIILSISSTELKEIKECETSRNVWQRLEEIYQSKGPARKAALLKQLILTRMQKDDDVREHLRKFFDAVDKLAEMEVKINTDLLAILLLYSLPSMFDNFRCAIESRDELPSSETLRVKIIEESDARKHDTQGDISNAMVANKRFDKQRRTQRKKNGLPVKDNTNTTKIKCYRCKKIGHKGSECRKPREKNEQSAQSAKHHLFYGVPETQAYKNNEYSLEHSLTQAAYANQDTIWCLDSGCSSHLSKNIDDLNDTCSVEWGKLHLANNASMDIKARGNVHIQVSLGQKTKRVKLIDALHVPDLRTNLMSVGKITDKGYRVIFEKDSAEIIND